MRPYIVSPLYLCICVSHGYALLTFVGVAECEMLSLHRILCATRHTAEQHVGLDKILYSQTGRGHSKLYVLSLVVGLIKIKISLL